MSHSLSETWQIPDDHLCLITTPFSTCSMDYGVIISEVTTTNEYGKHIAWYNIVYGDIKM